MSIDALVYTQIASILGYVGTLFTLYRVLIKQKDSVIQQKDSVIQLLKENLSDREYQINLLKAQTPDALASALSDRIKMSLDEIVRLKTDGHTHRQEIAQKEEELRAIQDRLGSLSELIKESDLVCPECGSPLVRRESHIIHGHSGDHEVEADLEYLEYECGLSLDDGRELSSCKHRTA